MSTAPARSAFWMAAGVNVGACWRRSAATPAVCGAAAEVPKNSQNGGQAGKPPALEIDTPSKAARSGLARSSRVGKSMRAGPRELNGSTASRPGSATSMAPTATTSASAGWPMMLPAVGAVLERGRAETEQLESARLAGEAIDHDVRDRGGGALVDDADDLDRILRAVLEIVARRDEAQVLVEKEEIVVAARGAEGVVPFEDAGEDAARRHHDGVGVVAAAEIVDVRPREVLLEVLLGLVAGRGVVRDAGLHRGTDRRRDRPVLEVRLAEEPEIVDDHVRARGGEALDRLAHPEAVGDAREEERRARRDVVHDLQAARCPRRRCRAGTRRRERSRRAGRRSAAPAPGGRSRRR